MNKKVSVEVYRFTPKPRPKGWKLKMGTIGWIEDKLYFPAGAAGMSEKEAMLALAYDGFAHIYADGIMLIPEAWARRNVPDRCVLFDLIRHRALAMRNSNIKNEFSVSE